MSTQSNASPPFPFDLTSPEGRAVWLQWLQEKAKANLAIELAKLEAAGLLKDGVWTLPDETPKDMQDDSETSVVTG